LFPIHFFEKKLVSHALLDGNMIDDSIEEKPVETGKQPNIKESTPKGPTPNEPTPKEPPKPKRMLVETMVETISSCLNEKEDDVLLHIINLLLTMAIHRNCPLHGRAFGLAFSKLIYIFSSKLIHSYLKHDSC